MRTEVTDISRAIAIIGITELRKWVFMIALMGLNTGKPDEIMRVSMIRGKFIEDINHKCGIVKSDESAFQTGLFSMLDVLMEVPMGSAFDGMLLPEEVRNALVYGSGPLYHLLELVISLERGNWDATDNLAQSLNINAGQISEIYLDAVKWCHDLAI